MSVARKGTMKVSLQDENGIVLTKDYGFVLEEIEGNPKAFDFFTHPDYGNVILLNQEVIFLKFWKTEDIRKLQKLMADSLIKELLTRDDSATLDS